ncbi:MAG: hypothetical protein ABJJ44_01050 [Paraglaciecola sp.]|uniref:hypothetical protein n=1 Tax=Paraglaciecola sp. TaxID=1920173 RepID=UPI003296C206
MASPDYKKYSLAELYDAQQNIDKEAYPDNYQLLLAEIKLKENAPKRQKISLAQQIENRVKELETKRLTNGSEKLKQQKLIRLFGYILLLVFIGVFSLPAFFHSYLIEPEYYLAINFSAWGIALISLILVYRECEKNDVGTIKLKQRKIFKLTTEKGDKKFLKYRAAISAIILALFAHFVAFKTLPVIAHEYLLTHKISSSTVTIADKRSRYRRKYCNGKVYINEYKYGSDDFGHICGKLSRHFWNSLEVGSKLKIVGTQSKLGFLVVRTEKSKVKPKP